VKQDYYKLARGKTTSKIIGGYYPTIIEGRTTFTTFNT
jgi:hypothetical protein